MLLMGGLFLLGFALVATSWLKEDIARWGWDTGYVGIAIAMSTLWLLVASLFFGFFLIELPMYGISIVVLIGYLIK